MTAPLVRLKQKDVSFRWGPIENGAFKKIQQSISKDTMLRSYDPNLPVELEVDASQKALGGVLSQEGQPVLFISKVLSRAETNYSQIEREALAIVWGIRRCHRFLCGRKFKLITDHRPLVFLLATDRELPTRVSARLQRWAIFLTAYDYDIEYRLTKNMKSDVLSRLVAEEDEATMEIGNVDLSENILSLKEVASATRKCREMRLLWRAILGDDFTHPMLRPYKGVHGELSTQDGVILRGQRMVIPRALRSKAINAVHQTHLGMVRTKSLARTEFWWPAMDKEIDRVISRCQTCRMAKPPNRNFRTSWTDAPGPWDRVHIDFAGPVQGQYLLVIVDSFSGYPEVHITNDMTTRTVIQRLRRTFAQFGIPRTLVSDNGPCFTSIEIAEWLKGIDCTHLTSPAYHPQSNGTAERFVRTIKEGIKANGFSQETVDRILLFYRSSGGRTGESPAELMFGRKLRVPFTTRQVNLQDEVVYKNSHDAPVPAKIILPVGRSMALIKTEEEIPKFKKAHFDQLQPFQRDGQGKQATDQEQSTQQHTQESQPAESDVDQPTQSSEPERSPQPRRSQRLAGKSRVFYRS